ncbi:hypothetical protein [Noviherbaspirillum cavernae]|uniref:hypothetical protein n=1 Tax=Noviherbaspirillum cavernae TaxID=2320862 RepID=UPI001F5B478E|nr:hypothetical protein [Noviherbaspirillum cavernae]
MKLLPCLAIAGDFRDFRILKNSRVKRDGLFGMVVKPQTGGDSVNALHDVPPGDVEPVNETKVRKLRKGVELKAMTSQMGDASASQQFYAM